MHFQVHQQVTWRRLETDSVPFAYHTDSDHFFPHISFSPCPGFLLGASRIHLKTQQQLQKTLEQQQPPLNRQHPWNPTRDARIDFKG